MRARGTGLGWRRSRPALRAQDRGVETCLLEEIEKHWGLQSRGELVALCEPAAAAGLCGAGGGGGAVRGRWRCAGGECAGARGAGAGGAGESGGSKMHQAGCAAGDARHVAFTGSVLEKISRVRRAMEEALQASMGEVEVAQKAVEPLEGALWRARRQSVEGSG